MSHAFGRNNSRSGSKKNIHAHYDLGNAFYERWLDPTMTYSSARFETPGETLVRGPARKYRTLWPRAWTCAPDHHVLEIGCGWGGFAEFAAREVGAKVTGDHHLARSSSSSPRSGCSDQGLDERADIRLVDYRDVEGQFDRVASIEMFEAVGERYWPTYFDKIREMPEARRPGRPADHHHPRRAASSDYQRTPDFIQKYIFPGGMLPSEERLKAATDRAGLRLGPIARFGRRLRRHPGRMGAAVRGGLGRDHAAWASTSVSAGSGAST